MGMRPSRNVRWSEGEREGERGERQVAPLAGRPAGSIASIICKACDVRRWWR